MIFCALRAKRLKSISIYAAAEEFSEGRFSVLKCSSDQLVFYSKKMINSINYSLYKEVDFILHNTAYLYKNPSTLYDSN